MTDSYKNAAQQKEPFDFLWWYPEQGFERLHDGCVDM